MVEKDTVTVGPAGPVRSSTLVRPAVQAPEFEVVGVGLRPQLRLLRLVDAKRDATARGVGHGFFERRELYADLRSRIVGARPAHQRLNDSRTHRLVDEHPFAGAGVALLHGGLCWLEDPGNHVVSRYSI